MNLSTSTPVVTGATGGLGRHLVDELLERGAPKVFALARDTSRIRRDPRIVPVAFDLLDAGTILAAARRAADATLLINNASTAEFAGPLDAAPDAVDREMAVNYHGTYAAIRAFVPVLEATGGRIVNVLSLLSLASSPPMTAPPAQVAAGLLDGLAADEEDIFPDPNAQAMAPTWWSDPKAFERMFSGAAAA